MNDGVNDEGGNDKSFLCTNITFSPLFFESAETGMRE